MARKQEPQTSAKVPVGAVDLGSEVTKALDEAIGAVQRQLDAARSEKFELRRRAKELAKLERMAKKELSLREAKRASAQAAELLAKLPKESGFAPAEILRLSLEVVRAGLTIRDLFALISAKTTNP